MYQVNYPPLMPKLPGSVRKAITHNMRASKMTRLQAMKWLCKSRYFCTMEQLEAKLAEKPPCSKSGSRNWVPVKEEACDCGVVEKLVTRLNRKMCRYCAALVNGQRNPDPTEEEIRAKCEAIREGRAIEGAKPWSKKVTRVRAGLGETRPVETQVSDFGTLSGRARTRLA